MKEDTILEQWFPLCCPRAQFCSPDHLEMLATMRLVLKNNKNAYETMKKGSFDAVSACLRAQYCSPDHLINVNSPLATMSLDGACVQQ